MLYNNNIILDTKLQVTNKVIAIILWTHQEERQYGETTKDYEEFDI